MSHGQRHQGDLASTSKRPTGAAGIRPFRLTESVVGHGCREIGVEGELDLSVADRLKQALARCQADHVLIDLKSCEFIDSTGIALILGTNRSDGSRIVLHSASDQVLRILEVTGLTANGLVFADREQALAVVRAVR